MIGRLSAALASVALALAAAGGAAAAAPAGWESRSIERSAGAVTATLSFERLRTPPGALSPSTDYRAIRLVLRQAGRTVIDRRLPARFDTTLALLELRLLDVRPGGGREAVIRASSCANRCSELLAVGLVDDAVHGRLLVHDFGAGLPGPGTAWKGRRQGGAYLFVSRDRRFFCSFTDCASTATPIQIFALDQMGVRLVDVTRAHPDLVAADAKQLLAEYQRELADRSFATKTREGYDALGVLGPWCADQSLLGRASTCRATLSQELARGHLGRWSRKTLDDFLHMIAGWGYR